MTPRQAANWGIREVIAGKREGRELSAEEIRFAVRAYMADEVSEAQMAAYLMAIALRGMTPDETATLTAVMVESGERLDLSAIPGIKVDKHSTGGVGDKTTLVVAPLVAAFGVPVPKMSGSALGHTGGTIDKLEAIAGLTTALSPERFRRQVAEIGVAIAAQSDRMVPADKRIYALRDATGTVESVPLIASSVMSKKLAAGADAIVLDVKAGRGAFMADVARAQELAEAMVGIGQRSGKRVVALVTRMDEPLGRAVGDAPELLEAVETLAGRGPGDFCELCEIVAGHMLSLGGAAGDPAHGRALAKQGLAASKGLPKLRQLVAAQGGSEHQLDDPGSLLGEAERVPVEIGEEGCVAAIDARRIGLAVRGMKDAAGRDKRICGVLLHKKSGDRVTREPVATLLLPRGMSQLSAEWANEVATAYTLADHAPTRPGAVAAVVGP